MAFVLAFTRRLYRPLHGGCAPLSLLLASAPTNPPSYYRQGSLAAVLKRRGLIESLSADASTDQVLHATRH